MDYYSKYLKYKKKYLNFKNTSGGAGAAVPIERSIIFDGVVSNNTTITKYSTTSQHILVRNEIINIQEYLGYICPSTAFGDTPNLDGYINNLENDQYFICIYHNGKRDTQIGITEGCLKDETFQNCATRGIFEEAGIHVAITPYDAKFRDTRVKDVQVYIKEITPPPENTVTHPVMPFDTNNFNSSMPKKGTLILLHGTMDHLISILQERTRVINSTHFVNSTVLSIRHIRKANEEINKQKIVLIHKDDILAQIIKYHTASTTMRTGNGLPDKQAMMCTPISP